ncbi:hypothetical protein M409DRAFT_66837 [Zasmidium cellare ATCC 36951]|uniref:Uncharacterized protein n=1 Tax=Zasmidium cellare ATCC 36951 TaxID=1080233 RepID=A0A6A6CFL0_ZASCE|nr:uncharacterized protein M409DRAFT_66837 [Zasmidium cellare ATCC 36951]KAF2165851.1 hypothetical protein M409DRAFT_66837 [Zasmidium cellare ATCC 36951]
MEQGPEPIQHPLRGEQHAASHHRSPLFLLHDGGGTTFAYHCLSDIKRPLYGITNPRFHDDGRVEGGMRGMGRLYAAMIRRTCTSPDSAGQRDSGGVVDILLGGWSLGGLLSLEVAKVLIKDRVVRVIGVLMMDSPCVRGMSSAGEGYEESLSHFDLTSPTRNMLLSIQAMREGMKAIRNWDLPVWNAEEVRRRPRFTLLRATDYVLVRSHGVHVIDKYRRDPNLGWDVYDPDLFTETEDVKGNHFELFSFKYIEQLTETIARCCVQKPSLPTSSRSPSRLLAA